MISAISCSVDPPGLWISDIYFILVAHQDKRHNDYGPCVKRVACAFATYAKGVMEEEVEMNFESLAALFLGINPLEMAIP